MTTTEPPRIGRIKTITCATADVFGVRVADLISTRRTECFVLIRHAAYLLIRKHTDATSSMIGREFGGRNQSTVRLGIIGAEKHAAACPKFRAQIDEAERMIVQWGCNPEADADVVRRVMGPEKVAVPTPPPVRVVVPISMPLDALERGDAPEDREMRAMIARGTRRLARALKQETATS